MLLDSEKISRKRRKKTTNFFRNVITLEDREKFSKYIDVGVVSRDSSEIAKDVGAASTDSSEIAKDSGDMVQADGDAAVSRHIFHETSGMSFSSLYMWSKEYRYSYDIIENHLCMAGLSNFEGEPEAPFLFPVLPEGGAFETVRYRSVLEELDRRFETTGKPFVMRLIPEEIKEIMQKARPDRYIFIEDPSNYDYLYKTSDLAALRGKRFHGKKNHVNRFNSVYEGRFAIEDISDENAEEIIEFVKRINAKKELKGVERKLLSDEERMMEEIMNEYDQIGLEGILLRIDGRPEGVAFGGRLGSDTIVEHVEKADVDYCGIYQKLNNEFCIRMQPRYAYVNREEDMGIEGLRRSKLSYKPIRLIKKYIALHIDDTEAMDLYGSPF